MNIQDIIVALAFLIALLLFCKRIYKSITPKGCTTGCGSCKLTTIKVETGKLHKK